MAIQLNRGPSAGAALGSAFGTGIGEALKGLTEGHQKQLSLQNMLQSGISPQDAQLIMKYAPQEQVKLLSQLWQKAPMGPGQEGAPGQGGMGFGQEGFPGQESSPQSSFYRPTREDVRKQEELNLKKESVDLRRQEALRNSPFFKGTQEKVGPSKEVLNVASSIREVLPKLKAVGPILGKMPAVSEEASLFDSLASQLLLLKSAAERIPGMRGSDFYFKLQQLSKVDRSQPPAVIERRLADMEQAAHELIKKGEIQDRVVEMHPNMSPSKAETLVKNVEKISNALPSGSEYEEGTEIKANDYIFKVVNGNWIYQGSMK